jgi:hypothetical protein
MAEDWFVVGVDPLQNHILVKCRLTGRTGSVIDPSMMELEKAAAQNFEPYPWVEHTRVVLKPLKAEVMRLSRQTQNMSGMLRRTQSLTTRIE